MNRLSLWPLVAVAALTVTATLSAQQPAEQPAEQPAAQQPPAEQQPAAQPPAEQQPPVQLIEATREEIWLLGEQRWDFRDVAATYVPVRGLLNPQTGVVEWTLEIVRDMSEGEAGLQENLEDTPFKPTFLDEDRLAVQVDTPVRITRITGKAGDRVRMTLRLPEEGTVKGVRIGRRTEVGF